jgi:glycosyltransferase involved in cell wall biosynthesis
MISIIVISKDEPSLEQTLMAVQDIKPVYCDGGRFPGVHDLEVVVVDASRGRLDYLRDHGDLHWVEYTQPPNVKVTIPHQRNIGTRTARGEVIVFIDAGCQPGPGWLEALTMPILTGRERIVTGLALASGPNDLYDAPQLSAEPGYVGECTTINLALDRALVEEVGGFDESFEYGSDIDFSWRVVASGTPIWRQADAVIEHDWGGQRRQVKRAYKYGQARVRLYRKHCVPLRRVLSDDPVSIVYPAFIVGLPVAVVWPWYPALLLIPAVRARKDKPARVVLDHLTFGLGILRELLPV